MIPRDQPVQFLITRPLFVRNWRKSRTEWSIVEDGRYGPRWMRRLVFWAAKRMGMIRHARDYSDQVHIVTIDPRAGANSVVDELRQKIVAAINEYGYRGDEIEVLCGPKQFGEPSLQQEFRMTFNGFGRFYDGKPQYHGIPIRCVPGVDGIVILPLERGQSFGRHAA